jgi:DNA-binding NarL/FixJ family response regulator
MPIMHGFEMIRELRHLSPVRDVNIIASSASVFEADQYESLNAGADEFLPKPISAESLLEMLKSHLHLEWIYEESSGVLLEASATEAKTNETDGEILPPPSEYLNTLKDLIKKGNLDEILEESEKIEKLGKEFLPFTQNVVQLAETFKVKELKDFVNQFIT